MARVRLRELCKRFGDNVVVDALSLDVADREFVTFLGPSGCGKTTTLRMIAGLETPTSGDILFDEARVNDMSPAGRNIAMVFQNYALYPHMTVRQNLEYPLRKRGVPRAERAPKVARVAALLQIETLLDRKPRQLSGGQQQRVALGRAMIRDPSVFLLDEPLSNLDAKLRSYMRGELIELHRRIGTTMIYVTHDQLEAMTMSDRIAVFDRGRLQQLGTPDEVYNRPRNRFVASFVGTPGMNFVDMKPTAHGERLTLEAPGLVLDLPRGPLGGLSSGRGVVAGIRPEDLAVGGGGWPGEVRLVEPAGHETIVNLRVGNATLVARAGADFRARSGDAVSVRANPDKIHLFAADTGERIEPGRQ